MPQFFAYLPSGMFIVHPPLPRGWLIVQVALGLFMVQPPFPAGWLTVHPPLPRG
jgi:hypothetical protein